MEREEKVVAKGKGELQTYWLKVADGSVASSSNVRSSQGSVEDRPRAPKVERPKRSPKVTTSNVAVASKAERLVQWNVELLSRHLKEILVQRDSTPKKVVPNKPAGRVVRDHYGDNILGEVKDVLELPKLDPSSSVDMQHVDHNAIQLSTEVQQQLTDYVRKIASLYHDNPFHNWGKLSFVCLPFVCVVPFRS